MKVGAVIARLEALVPDERAALRRLDSAAVADAAEEKERLFVLLAAAPEAELRPFAERLRKLAVELRHNCVLLMHARDCVRDALAAAGMAPVRPSSTRPTRREPRFTVRG
jgi:hypothetical protein